MLPKAEMFPKECGFIQSEKYCGLCAGIAWRFPCSPATARDDELIEMQHSCHHIDIIRHPNSSYITTKLYGITTCGCNNNMFFSERTIVTFPTVALMIHAKVERWQHCWIAGYYPNVSFKASVSMCINDALVALFTVNLEALSVSISSRSGTV